MVNVWVVVAISCENCNSFGLAVYDHEPNGDEIGVVKDRIGSMYCIREILLKTEINGSIVECKISKS